MAECPKYITYRKVKETETEVLYEQFLPQTNADRIRMMSDEELAEVISNLGDCDTCYLYHKGCNINISCKDAVLEWLKKESE